MTISRTPNNLEEVAFARCQHSLWKLRLFGCIFAKLQRCPNVQVSLYEAIVYPFIIFARSSEMSLDPSLVIKTIPSTASLRVLRSLFLIAKMPALANII